MKRSDSERVDFLAAVLNGDKWSDTLPMIRPRNVLGEHTEKYIEADSFREAVDKAMDRAGIPHRP